MISVTVEIREDGLTRRVRITAPSIKQALQMAGEGRSGRRVHVLFPIDPEAFFPENHTQRKAA